MVNKHYNQLFLGLHFSQLSMTLLSLFGNCPHKMTNRLLTATRLYINAVFCPPRNRYQSVSLELNCKEGSISNNSRFALTTKI